MDLYHTVNTADRLRKYGRRSREKDRAAHLSLDDTTDSSDYPRVAGGSTRKMINSENAVQIAKRYLRKHAKSLKVRRNASPTHRYMLSCIVVFVPCVMLHCVGEWMARASSLEIAVSL